MIAPLAEAASSRRRVRATPAPTTLGRRWPVLLALVGSVSTCQVAKGEPPTRVALAPPASPDLEPEGGRRLIRPRAAAPGDDPGAPARPGGGGNWWFGTAGVAAALAACGWASLASRRHTAGTRADARGRPLPPLRVVGRTPLTPRHAVYLLQAGERVLILGTGPQGAPSLLGELAAGSVDEAPGGSRLPHEDAPTSERPRGPGPLPDAPARFDYRLGDDA